jgi:hypothetical protein
MEDRGSKMLALTEVMPKRAAGLARRANFPALGSARTIATPGAMRSSPSAMRDPLMTKLRVQPQSLARHILAD